MTAYPITVIVCTFNRKDILRLCLQALEAQSRTDFEVIVVDDGSSDGTREMLVKYQSTTPLRMQVLAQENSGPARARNIAVACTHTPLAMLIGDDIVATPTLVEAHLQFHLENPAHDKIALGWTRWDETHQAITPFMKWYEKHQFDYHRLLQGLEPSWKHGYTSNISFKTSLLKEHPFDERFRAAAWEDSELAYRLWRLGRFQLAFVREAVATHIHPTTFQQAWKRMETLGRMERLVHTLHPELTNELRSDPFLKMCSFLGRHPRLLQATTDAVGKISAPGKLHSMVLRSHHQLTYLAD